MVRRLGNVLREWVTPTMTAAGFQHARSAYTKVDSRGSVTLSASSRPVGDGRIRFELDFRVAPNAYIRYDLGDASATADEWHGVGLVWRRVDPPLTHNPGDRLVPVALTGDGPLFPIGPSAWSFPSERGTSEELQAGRELHEALRQVVEESTSLLDPVTMLTVLREGSASRWHFTMSMSWALALILGEDGPSEELDRLKAEIANKRPDSSVLAWLNRT